MTPEHQAIVALAGGIAVVFGLLMKKNASQDKQLEDCNKDRDRLNGEIVGIWKSLAKAGIKPVGNPETPQT